MRSSLLTACCILLIPAFILSQTETEIRQFTKQDWLSLKHASPEKLSHVIELKNSLKKKLLAERNQDPIRQQQSIISSCNWIEPTDEYIHPNPIQWPGSPGNSTDNFSEVIDLGWNFNFFGVLYNQVIITTKGTLILGNSGYIDYTPSAFPNPLATETTQQYNHIAAFWTDSDFGASGEIYYRLTSSALYVNFINVGYWPNRNDKVNTFQIIITADNSPVLNGDNVQFVYQDMQYVNSQINGAIAGCQASTNFAIVGADRAAGPEHFSFGRFNICNNSSYTSAYATAPANGVDWLDGKTIQFNTSMTSWPANLASIPISHGCQSFSICQGEELNLNTAFVSPEANQTISLTYTQTMSGFSATTSSGSVAILNNASFVATPENIGLNVITIYATDNGNPSLISSITYTIYVSDLSAPPISISGIAQVCDGQNSQLTASPGFETYLWNTGESGQSIIAAETAVYSVVGTSGGCRSEAIFSLNILPPFIPQLLGGNTPVEACNGDTAIICVLGDYSSYAWSIVPEYEGEFTQGAATDRSCAEVIASTNGTYMIEVIDNFGCRGFNIKLVTTDLNTPCPSNDLNTGTFNEGLEPIDFCGASLPPEDNLIIYALSTNQNGWQGSYLNIYKYPADGGPVETYFLTSFGPLTLYDDILIGANDSIAIEYVDNGNTFVGNSLWVINCGQNTPSIISAPLTNGIIWSARSTCLAEDLTGTWEVFGPSQGTFTSPTSMNTSWLPDSFGDYNLCFTPTGANGYRLTVANESFNQTQSNLAGLWQGNTSLYTVNNNALQLNAGGSGANQTSIQLSTPITSGSIEWNFSVSHLFASSAANQSRIYLGSNQPAYAYSGSGSAGVQGYFLQFGEALSADVIRLFRDDGNSITLLCSGITNISSAFEIDIKIIKDELGNWTILRSDDQHSFSLEANCVDLTYSSFNYFSIINSFTFSFSSSFIFDDLVIENSSSNYCNQEFCYYFSFEPPITFYCSEIIPSEIALCNGETALLGSQVLWEGPSNEELVHIQDFECSTSYLYVSEYPDNAIITSSSDILSIELNIEHSYVGDLIVSITCPNGQIMNLIPEEVSSQAFLGEPFDEPFDQPNDSIGVGYTYYFSDGMESLINYLTAFNPQTLPTGNYQPGDSFENLIGCPINGIWELEICDYVGADEGYLFSFGINVSESISPDNIVTAPFYWSTGETVSSINVQPPSDMWYYLTSIGSNEVCVDSVFIDVSAINLELNAPDGNFLCSQNNLQLVAQGAEEYLWSTGETEPIISVNQPGTYSVTGFTGNCTETQQILIGNSNWNLLVQASDTILCQNESAFIFASGAIEYLWNNGSTDSFIEVSTPGSYQVTATGSDGCTYESEQIDIGSGEMNLSVAASDSVICNNQPSVLIAFGAEMVVWNTGAAEYSITVSEPGTYYFTGSNEHCTQFSQSIEISQGTVPELETAISENVLCLNSPEALLTAIPSGGIWSGPGIINDTFQASLTGAGLFELIYTYTNGDGCSNSDSLFVAVNDCILNIDESLHSDITIFPNPAIDGIVITGISDRAFTEFRLIDAAGRLVHMESIDPYQKAHEIWLNNIASGVYWIRLTGTEFSYQSKLIKN
jgi:subtilisin-like proprotein convertase family protein